MEMVVVFGGREEGEYWRDVEMLLEVGVGLYDG